MIKTQYLDRVIKDINNEYNLYERDIEGEINDLRNDSIESIDEINKYIGNCKTFPGKMNYINEEVSNCFSYRKRTINGYLNSFYNHSEKIIYDDINQIKKDVKNTLSAFSTIQTKKYTRYINMTGADSHYDRVSF